MTGRHADPSVDLPPLLRAYTKLTDGLILTVVCRPSEPWSGLDGWYRRLLADHRQPRHLVS